MTISRVIARSSESSVPNKFHALYAIRNSERSDAMSAIVYETKFGWAGAAVFLVYLSDKTICDDRHLSRKAGKVIVSVG
jgi:hypothetical protein